MAKDRVIEVEGLNAFRRDLRKMGPEYRKELDRVLRDAATPIAAEAKREYRSRHPRSRRGRGSQRGIRATASGGKARIILSLSKYPWLIGQEFGSHGRWPQFPSPWNMVGRFLWPSIRRGTAKAMKQIDAGLDEISKKYFPD